MPAPTLIQNIPSQIINEQAAFAPFDLKEYIEPGNENTRFSAGIKSGESLPHGMILTSDGILTGIPAKDTKGNYQIVVSVENEEGQLETEFVLTIKPSLLASEAQYADEFKSQIWEALEKGLAIPDLTELAERPVTPMDIYYLLERWACLTIWDAFNLEPAGPKIEITLEGASPHYVVYDRGSSLVAAPRDLFSHERTLEDALQTSRAMAREVYQRNWTIEFAGFEKMMRAAWVELQLLSDHYGKAIEIINFDPSLKDMKIYNDEVLNTKLRKEGL